MLYVVQFEDDPTLADSVRRRDMPAHLDFLARHADHIKAAGPLRDAGDGSPAGGLWLIEADGYELVAELIQEDPFWPTGLRRSVRVLEWRQVFADGAPRS